MAKLPGSPRPGRRLPLTALSPGVKVTVSIGWLVVIGAWAAVLALSASAPGVGSAVVIALAVVAVAVSLPLTVLLVEAWRFRAWLEGTTLVVRHAGAARRCDLGRSSIKLSRGRLTARDGVARQRVRLQIARPASKSSRLGARELSALADAIADAGRRDPDAQRVAAELRAQAGSLPGRRPR
jgi:hypothetical protein